MGIQTIITKQLDIQISGLSYITNFIDPQTEENLIRLIDDQLWIADLKRRVQHYGYRYDYKARNVTHDLKLGDIPSWLMPYCVRLQQEGLFERAPDQVIINEYEPGQGIAAHIDCVPCFGNTVASLSLGSSCLMDFQNNQTHQRNALWLEPKSLLVLSDESRYKWKHGISARKTDKYDGEIVARQRRLSLTFRNVIAID